MANLKQISLTALSVMVFWALAYLAKRSKRYGRVLFWLTIIIGIIVTLAVLIVGPLLYNSWGCRNLIFWERLLIERYACCLSSPLL